MYHCLRSVGNIRSFLDRDTCVRAVLRLVISRLYYTNSLLVGQSRTALCGLQVARNWAARVITSLQGHHVTPALRDLHWLPVQECAAYKVLCLVYETPNCMDTPSYMRSALSWCTAVRTRRSGSDAARLRVLQTVNRLTWRPKLVLLCAYTVEGSTQSHSWT